MYVCKMPCYMPTNIIACGFCLYVCLLLQLKEKHDNFFYFAASHSILYMPFGATCTTRLKSAYYENQKEQKVQQNLFLASQRKLILTLFSFVLSCVRYVCN